MENCSDMRPEYKTTMDLTSITVSHTQHAKSKRFSGTIFHSNIEKGEEHSDRKKVEIIFTNYYARLWWGLGIRNQIYLWLDVITNSVLIEGMHAGVETKLAYFTTWKLRATFNNNEINMLAIEPVHNSICVCIQPKSVFNSGISMFRRSHETNAYGNDFKRCISFEDLSSI